MAPVTSLHQRYCHAIRLNVLLHAGPTAWNLLPVNIRAENSQIKFKKLLKTNFLISLFAVDCVFIFVIRRLRYFMSRNEMRLCSFSNERNINV